jgi:hypothetical protein
VRVVKSLCALLVVLILLAIGLGFAAWRLSRVAFEERVVYLCYGSPHLPLRGLPNGELLTLYAGWDGPYHIEPTRRAREAGAIKVDQDGVTRRAWLYVVVADEEPEVVMAH